MVRKPLRLVDLPTRTYQLGSPLGGTVELLVEEVSPDVAPALLRKQHSTNDNYCIVNVVPVARSMDCVLNVQRQNFSVTVQPPVLCPVVSPVHSVLSVWRLSQKKDISPSSKSKTEINSVKGVSIVDHCVFAQNVPSALNVAHVKAVGGRLQSFWQIWSLLGVNPRVVSILKDGYILLFKLRPPLVRDPLIISGYANPHRNLYLKEDLHALIIKKAVERVRVRTSLAFFSRLFIVPKPKQKWWSILDLSALNKFLSIKAFKMETPETIWISLQQGEWVTWLDFSNAYFHIPVLNRYQKFLPKPDIPVPGSSLRPLNSSYGVHLCGQRGQVNGLIPGFKDPPVPRLQVDLSPHQRILPPGHPTPPCPLPGVGLASEPPKIRAQTSFQICGLPIRPFTQTGQTDPEPFGVNSTESVLYSV